MLFIFLSSTLCKSQFYKAVLPSSEFTTALEKIVLDFRLNFKTIQGNSIDIQDAVDTYESTGILPGSNLSIMFNYHSKAGTTGGWAGRLDRGDEN